MFRTDPEFLKSKGAEAAKLRSPDDALREALFARVAPFVPAQFANNTAVRQGRRAHTEQTLGCMCIRACACACI